MNEHNHEKVDSGQNQPPIQQEAESLSHSPPAYTPDSGGEPPRRANAGASGTFSPYGHQDWGAYAKQRGAGAFRYSSANTRAGTGGAPPYYRPGPAGQYQWNFQQYDNALPAKKRKAKNRGLVVFAVTMLCVLSLGMASIIGYSLLSQPAIEDSPAGESPGGAVEQQQSGLPPEIGTPPQSASGEVNIHIETRPPTSDYMPVPGERMTIPQVARAVRPSVVGVVNYRTNQLLMPATEGSGIIISEDGYILTNAHVVDRAEAIVIVFDDESQYEALLVGKDMRTDIAVLKVDRTGLPAAVLGDSDQLEVGETVVAIGNPGGLELAGTVTRGVVSAVGRVISTPYHSITFIQTDAAINPGNSGGPLCNEFGQVIGINTAKIVEVGYEGIGFAIPITDALPIIEDLIRNGRVTGRVLLGITGEIVSEVISRDRNQPAGVQIVTIENEGMLEQGVLRGDIITYMDGQRILNLNDIRAVLDTKRVGDSATVTLHRPGGARTGTTFDVEIPLIEDMR